MSGKPLNFERTGDRQIDQLQRNVNDRMAPILASPFGAGQWIRGVSFVAATPKTIAHGLGRQYTGWFPTRIVGASGATPTNSTAQFGEINPQPTGQGALSITLVSSQTCVGDVWLF